MINSSSNREEAFDVYATVMAAVLRYCHEGWQFYVRSVKSTSEGMVLPAATPVPYQKVCTPGRALLAEVGQCQPTGTEQDHHIGCIVGGGDDGGMANYRWFDGDWLADALVMSVVNIRRMLRSFVQSLDSRLLRQLASELLARRPDGSG